MKTTTDKIKQAAHQLIKACNEYEKARKSLNEITNARDYDKAQQVITDSAKCIEAQVDALTDEMNVLLCLANVLEINEFYRLKKFAL